MSARFGRNQRRRLRAEIAARDREIERLSAVCVDHYRDKVAHLQARERAEGEMVEWADRIVTILGRNSAFARELERRKVDPDEFQRFVDGMTLRLEAPTVESLRPTDARAVRTAAKIVETFAMYADASRDEVAHRIRLEVRDKTGRAALMLDDRTAYVLKARSGNELARYLMQHLLRLWLK